MDDTDSGNRLDVSDLCDLSDKNRSLLPEKINTKEIFFSMTQTQIKMSDEYDDITRQ